MPLRYNYLCPHPHPPIPFPQHPQCTTTRSHNLHRPSTIPQCAPITSIKLLEILPPILRGTHISFQPSCALLTNHSNTRSHQYYHYRRHHTTTTVTTSLITTTPIPLQPFSSPVSLFSHNHYHHYTSFSCYHPTPQSLPQPLLSSPPLLPQPPPPAPPDPATTHIRSSSPTSVRVRILACVTCLFLQHLSKHLDEI